MKDFWDQRYGETEYIYGEKPNAYFSEHITSYPAGRLLMPAEGEGRNAVYAATLSWDVSAFDLSEQGKLKALALAQKHNVVIDYIVGDCADLQYPTSYFDAIGLIYAHFPAEGRADYFRQLVSYLKKDGIILFEAFSKGHVAYQLTNPTAGGPKDEALLFTLEEIKSLFPGIAFLDLREEEITLQEGAYHAGKAKVIRFTGKKL